MDNFQQVRDATGKLLFLFDAKNDKIEIARRGEVTVVELGLLRAKQVQNEQLQSSETRFPSTKY